MVFVLKLDRLSIYDELGELTTEPVCPFLKLGLDFIGDSLKGLLTVIQLRVKINKVAIRSFQSVNPSKISGLSL